jgi:hypothetical protein
MEFTKLKCGRAQKPHFVSVAFVKTVFYYVVQSPSSTCRCAVDGEEERSFAHVGLTYANRPGKLQVELFNMAAIKSLPISAGDYMKDTIKESTVRLVFGRTIFSASPP